LQLCFSALRLSVGLCKFIQCPNNFLNNQIALRLDNSNQVSLALIKHMVLAIVKALPHASLLMTTLNGGEMPKEGLLGPVANTQIVQELGCGLEPSHPNCPQEPPPQEPILCPSPCGEDVAAHQKATTPTIVTPTAQQFADMLAAAQYANPNPNPVPRQSYLSALVARQRAAVSA
jgi:hypothetical protein